MRSYEVDFNFSTEIFRVCKGTEKLFDLPYDQQSFKGLGGLVKSLFDVGLDKTYQISDWSKRPLRPQQLVYAAIDAYVCVAVFSKLEDLAEEHNRQVNFSKWVEVFVKHKNKLPKGYKFQAKKEVCRSINLFTRYPRWRVGHSWALFLQDKTDEEAAKSEKKAKLPAVFLPSRPLNATSISPPELRVVCDTMLQGLCKKLRLRGVDAVALESYEYFENCAKVAVQDKRMILTRGSHARKLQTMVEKQGYCYSVRSDQLDAQLEEVFWYFNVDQDDKYLFSRCQACNGDKYATLTSYQVKYVLVFSKIASR